MKRQLTLCCLAVVCVAVFSGADWRQFRGNNVDGVAGDQPAPKSLDKIAWKIDLPGRGLSGPIVIGDRVVVTSSSGFRQDRLRVHCFDAKSGDQLWERQFWATGRTQCHNKMCVATPTPASDGKRIFAFYSSNDLACLDLDGNLLWFRGLTHDFPNASNSLGMSSSPVVVGNTLVVQVESDDDSFATGLDVATGLARWKIERPRKANWTSPAILRGSIRKEDLVLLQSSAGLQAVRPDSGEIAWSYTDGASTIPSSTVAGQTIYVPSNGITALRPGATGEPPEQLWRETRLGPSTPSPLVYRGRIYTVNSSGVLKSADVKTGKVAWQLRLEGRFASTPIAADGHLYFFNEKGQGQIVKVGKQEGEIVNTTDLKETILCTPAIVNGAVYVRSDAHLWKFVR